MKCNKCGTDNPKGKSVCKKCGAFLYSSNPNNRVPLTKKQKRERVISIAKGSAYGCLWTTLAIIGMFIVLGLLSYLFVRFIMPEDMLENMVPEDMTTQETQQDDQDGVNATDDVTDLNLQIILEAIKTV